MTGTSHFEFGLPFLFFEKFLDGRHGDGHSLVRVFTLTLFLLLLLLENIRITDFLTGTLTLLVFEIVVFWQLELRDRFPEVFNHSSAAVSGPEEPGRYPPSVNPPRQKQEDQVA